MRTKKWNEAWRQKMAKAPDTLQAVKARKARAAFGKMVRELHQDLHDTRPQISQIPDRRTPAAPDPDCLDYGTEDANEP